MIVIVLAGAVMLLLFGRVWKEFVYRISSQPLSAPTVLSRESPWILKYLPFIFVTHIGVIAHEDTFIAVIAVKIVEDNENLVQTSIL